MPFPSHSPSLSTQLLASSIPIADDEIHYIVYEGDYSAVWDFRRRIVEEEQDISLANSISKSKLWTVQVVSQSIHRFWLFQTGHEPFSIVHAPATLIKVAESTITPRHLYPCSEECSHSTMPCSNCSPTPHPNLNSNSPTTAAEYLPRRPWRRAWNAFIDAVKARVIRDVNRGSRSTNRTAIALKSGFILHPNYDPHPDTNSEEWVTSGWEHILVRPLLYVHIQIRPILDSDPNSDSQLKLVVHPTITQTPYYGFRSPGSLASPHAAHVVPGTALTLLPFGTPAYFIAPYSGPTSALAAQFHDVLGGLGVDGWDSKAPGRPSRKDSKPTSYAIVYIPVHKAGVEGQTSQRFSNKSRGVTIIYPSRLVLTLPASIRQPLNPALLPPLPAALMPSPMVTFAVAAGVGIQPGLGPSATLMTGNGSINSPIAGPGHRINSPIVGHGLRQFQFPPTVTVATPISSSSGAGNPNVFPTLNSPLGAGFGFNQVHGHTHLQLQQQQQQHIAPSPSASNFVPSPLPANPSINASSGFLTSTLLRAHRAVSTASRLRNDSDVGGATTTNQGSGGFHPGAPTPGTTVGAPTPSGGGAPTPGTVSAATPGAPTPGAGTGSVSAPTPGATAGTPGGPGSGTGFRFIPSSTTSLSSLSLTAAEVSSYVDHVAREREKEREKLREAQQRERLGLGNARNASSTTNIGSSASGSSTSTGTRSVHVPPLSIPPNSNTHPALIPPPATSANTDAQMFYPSPPTNPPSVSASGAMSPVIGAIHGPATLPPPQLPQGLPSMHDVQSSKGKLEPPPPPQGEMDHVAEGVTEVDNSTVKVEEALTEMDTKPNIISEPQSQPAAAPTASAHDPTSTWSNYGYFGSEGMDLAGMGMDMGMGNDDMMNMNMAGMGMSMNINGMSDNMEMKMDMDMDMALFGVDSGSFDLSNFGGGDWNMDSTFGFGSSSRSGAPAPAGQTPGNGGAAANSSFPSFNGFSQPVPPSMNRAVTAPSHMQTQAQTQTQTQKLTQRSTTEWEEAFTDDDFSFFDHKSSASSSTMLTGSSSMISPPPPASAPPAINHNPNAPSSPDPLAFLVNSDDPSSFFSSLGLGVPNMNSISSASVATPGSSSYYPVPNPNTPGGLGLGGGFTPSPLTVNIEVEMDPGLPSPPDEADSANAYQVELERSRGNIPSPLSSPFRLSPTRAAHSQFAGTVPSSPSKDKDKKFAPIPFAKSHSLADGKYRVAGGKFALLRSSSGWFHKRPRLRPPYLASSGQEGRRASWITEAGTDGWKRHMLTGSEDHSNLDKEDDGRSEVERGKWTLPSPPVDGNDTDSSDDEDLVPKFSPPLSSSGAHPPPISLTITPPASNVLRPGWRPRYDRATDPRIGVVRKLTGHRSKKQQGSGSNPLKRKQPRWIRNWEEETGRHVETGHVQSDDDSEMDDDDDDDDDEGTVDENEDEVMEEDEGMDGIIEGSSSKKLRKFGHRERSRPPTPLPAYLPPGPSLVATCFHWVHLVNLVGGESTITTSEGMISEPYQTQLPPFQGIHGVPTPVSPATFTGGMSTAASPAFAPTPGPTSQALTPSADVDSDEKTRTFEAIACAIARESVENYIWMDSWDTVEGLVGDSQCGADSPSNAKWNMDGSIGCVWPLEVRAVKQLLVGSKIFGSEMLEIGDIFEAWSPTVPTATSFRTAPSSSSSLIPLHLPLLSVAKSEAIIHVMPTALRFWDKLGLGPKSGEKNVTAFVINGGELESDPEESGFEKATKWRDEQIERWLRNTSELYKARQLGEMVLGKSNLCQTDGVVSLQFDSSFKKTLESFVRSLPTLRDSFVFFILTPLSFMTLTSDPLRHLLSAVQNVTATHPQAHILFQFVPEPQILNTAVHPSSPQDFCSWSFVASLYDRILMPVDRAMSREFFTHGKRVKKYFQAPMFSLARSLNENKISYSGSTDPSLDVLDRHTFIHVGYQLSSCGRWILAACTDQRGEAHDLGVWSTQPGLQGNKKDDDESCTDVGVVTDEMYVVGKVWEFAMQFAEKANVEWRIVFAKLGAMGAVELDAWMTHLYTALHSISKNAQAPVHVSVVGVEPSAPWISPPKPSQSPSPVPPHPHLNVPKGSLSSLSRAVSGSLKTSSKSQVFVDTSTVAYAVFQKDSISIPISVPPTLSDFGLASDVLMNTNMTMLVHPENLDDDDLLVDLDNIPLLPLSSSALVRMPASSNDSLALSQMVHVHLLYAAKSEGSAYPTVVSNATDGHQSLLQDITNSFYSLSVLSSARGLYTASNSNSLLPLHLVAVATMRNALSARISADSFNHYL